MAASELPCLSTTDLGCNLDLPMECLHLVAAGVGRDVDLQPIRQPLAGNVLGAFAGQAQHLQATSTQSLSDHPQRQRGQLMLQYVQNVGLHLGLRGRLHCCWGFVLPLRAVTVNIRKRADKRPHFITCIFEFIKARVASKPFQPHFLDWLCLLVCMCVRVLA